MNERDISDLMDSAQKDFSKIMRIFSLIFLVLFILSLILTLNIWSLHSVEESEIKSLILLKIYSIVFPAAFLAASLYLFLTNTYLLKKKK